MMERGLAGGGNRREQVVRQALIDLGVTGPLVEDGIGALTRQRRQRIRIRRRSCAETIEPARVGAAEIKCRARFSRR
jgi:hypothetical protein